MAPPIASLSPHVTHHRRFERDQDAKDPWEILGLERGCSDEDAKRAYKKQVRNRFCSPFVASFVFLQSRAPLIDQMRGLAFTAATLLQPNPPVAYTCVSHHHLPMQAMPLLQPNPPVASTCVSHRHLPMQAMPLLQPNPPVASACVSHRHPPMQAMRLHPDRVTDPHMKRRAERAFKQLNEAYRLLSDPVERATLERQRRGGE
jgi:hypothetical protein